MQFFSFVLQNICAVKWSNYILDAVTILFIIGYAIVCMRKGFVECFFGFVTVTISLILAFSLAKVALSATGGLFGAQKALTASFTEKFGEVEGFSVAIPANADGLEAALKEQELPSLLVGLAVKWFGSGEGLPEGATIASILGEVCARLLSLLLAGVLVFVVSFIVLFLLKKILSAIVKALPILGTANALLGACVGVFQALLIIYAILGIVTLIPSAAIEGYVSNSLFLGWLSEQNLIVKCFGLML